MYQLKIIVRSEDFINMLDEDKSYCSIIVNPRGQTVSKT